LGHCGAKQIVDTLGDRSSVHTPLVSNGNCDEQSQRRQQRSSPLHRPRLLLSNTFLLLLERAFVYYHSGK
jgi:hypothetical protein